MGKLSPHIPANMEQIIMFKVTKSHKMKINHNSHYLALTHTAWFDAFSGSITQLMCLQLVDKYLIKIINMTENFYKFVLNFIYGFFLLSLFATTNLGRIHFYIYLYIK